MEGNKNTMNAKNMLDVRGLTKKYEKFKLDNINFSLETGKITGLIGANGAGKSTTMKLLLRIIEPDSGDIVFQGENIAKNKRMLYKENIGYVGENMDFFSKCQLKDIKKFYKSFYSAWDENYYKMLFEKFNLNRTYKIMELSKGMRMKFNLCLALSHSPQLLLLDEPTSGLDPLVRNEILNILKNYVERSKSSVLFSSHITEDMTKIADDLLFINQGKIIERCETKKLLAKGYEIDGYLENLVNNKEI